MQQLTTPLKISQRLPSPPNSKPKTNFQKAASFVIPLKDEKSQPLIPTLRRQSSEKCSVSLQPKASRIPILQARSNIEILPPIKATQSYHSNQHEQRTSGCRKVSFRLPLIDVKEFRSQY